MLNVAELAPDFSVQDQDGKPTSLKQFRGKHVVLWFYPKADTPG
jgi:peroxiredoxin Q/BCP